MSKTAVVWRESVYKNNFRCSHCGTPLLNPATKAHTDELMINPEGTALYCGKCGTLVAVLKPYDGDETGGQWKGDL